MISEILIKGLVMGLAVAAPVGPIGLLCIRRTLSDGRGAGLASGLGAASADAVYGLAVAMGLAATGILTDHARPMQILGGLLLAWLGISALRKARRPAPAAAPAPATAAHRLVPAFVTTFALTLANPMTILTFLGMVASLGQTASLTPLAPYWLVAGVFAGSALWWLFLVSLAHATRRRLGPALTRGFDIGSGAILLVWGLWVASGL